MAILGMSFGQALCAHFGLPADKVGAGLTMNTGVNDVLSATLTIKLSADDMAAIAKLMPGYTGMTCEVLDVSDLDSSAMEYARKVPV